MGYFSNGTEGEMYQRDWCNRCVHDVKQDCPIWLAHLVHNGDKDDLLDLFIPRSKDRLSNEKCRMFVSRGPHVVKS